MNLPLHEIGRRYEELHTLTGYDVLNMRRAIYLARVAIMDGQEPFGCVVVDRNNRAIGEGRGTGTELTPLEHSECVAINEACSRRQGLLRGCTLYSTHEPCPMCCGAINHAELTRVVFGTYRSDLPGRFRPCSINWKRRLADTSHPPAVIPGVLRSKCEELWEGRRNRP